MTLRFFFDFGSGTVLWAGDDRTRDGLGYAIRPCSLPVDENLHRRAEFLAAWWDTFLDWSSPPEMSVYWQSERNRFDDACDDFLVQLRAQLGEGTIVLDQRKMKREADR